MRQGCRQTAQRVKALVTQAWPFELVLRKPLTKAGCGDVIYQPRTLRVREEVETGESH